MRIFYNCKFFEKLKENNETGILFNILSHGDVGWQLLRQKWSVVKDWERGMKLWLLISEIETNVVIDWLIREQKTRTNNTRRQYTWAGFTIRGVIQNVGTKMADLKKNGIRQCPKLLQRSKDCDEL